MFMKLLNICASVMLSASCVNGLSSLDHKPLPYRAFPNSHYFIGSNSSTLAPHFIYNDDNYEITNDFLSFVNTSNHDFISFRSLTLSYNRDTDYSSLVDKSIFRIYDSSTSVGHNYLDVYIDDYHIYDFTFVPILSSYFNPVNYLMYINLDYYDSSDSSFYSVSYLYSFDAQLSKGGPHFDYPYDYFKSNLIGTKSNFYDFSFSNSNLDSLKFTILFFNDVNLTTSNSYDLGYSNGYSKGYSVGYNEGKSVGYSTGYSQGQADNSGAKHLFLSIADTPLLMLRSLFNFDFFGVNFFIIVVSLLTLLMLIFIIKKFI